MVIMINQGAMAVPASAGAISTRYSVLGVPISAVDPGRATAAIEAWANDDIGRYVCVRDVASLMACRKDPVLLGLHHRASMVVPDGMPLVWIGRRRGMDVERTCGPDLLDLVCSRSPRTGLKHFFYGGKPGVADKLASVMRKRYPGISVVGTHCPPFRDLSELERAEVIAKIRKSGADVVWVGISSPKQDLWMHEMVGALPQTLIGVGAAFDFHSGEVRRAPVFMQRNGLEWLHRLCSEPRRLWRRYLIQAPTFVWLVMTSRANRVDAHR